MALQILTLFMSLDHVPKHLTKASILFQVLENCIFKENCTGTLFNGLKINFWYARFFLWIRFAENIDNFVYGICWFHRYVKILHKFHHTIEPFRASFRFRERGVIFPKVNVYGDVKDKSYFRIKFSNVRAKGDYRVFKDLRMSLLVTFIAYFITS